MEKNINPEINRLNMETSKQAADSLRQWAGLDSPKAPVASSFLNGSTAQHLNESTFPDISTKSTKRTSFNFGVLNTVSALKNTSLNELPAGKILLEKYSHLLIDKGISESFIIESLIEDLKSFSWENSVKPVLENLTGTFEKNRREVEVLKTYETIKNNAGRELFSDATDQMKNWLTSEKRTSDSLIHGLKRFGFNPMVRNLVSFLSIYESKEGTKFNVGFDNNICEIDNIYSPVYVNENEVIFYSSGKFLKLQESEGNISECNMDEVSEELQNKASILSDRDIRVENNRILLNLGNNKIEISFVNESKKILFDGKEIKEEDLPLAVSVSTNNLLENTNHKINKAVYISNVAEEIIDLDFGKKIKSKVYEGVEANVFKIGGTIYVQTVNPSMKLNKIYEANATQAINIIRDFIKYDISESLTEFLEGEEAFLSVMKNDKKEIIKNIEILENELRKIDVAKEQNPLISNSKELISLEESIENEIGSLKDRWNQINLEIERFEKKAKDISSNVNEDLGYPIDTEVRVKRNGVKGKVIGVDGSSKTYTILFKEGKTGEYFFSDVEDLNDEVSNFDIKTPDLDLEFSDDLTNESNQNFADAPGGRAGSHKDRAIMNLSKKHMASAPNKKTGSSPKFIENEANSNLGKTPKTGKKAPLTGNKVKTKDSNLAKLPKGNTAKGKNFIDNLDNLDLAKAPSGSVKGSAKFIEDLKNMNLAIKENQKNSHFEKAPAGSKEKPKKFIEKEERANLADAHGNSKKNGKRFAEKDSVAGLASAPKSKSRAKKN
jgi:hypothetical protein